MSIGVSWVRMDQSVVVGQLAGGLQIFCNRRHDQWHVYFGNRKVEETFGSLIGAERAGVSLAREVLEEALIDLERPSYTLAR
jgi:hypothetical protein